MRGPSNTPPPPRPRLLGGRRLCIAGVLLAVMQSTVVAQRAPSTSQTISGDTSFEQGLLALNENRLDTALEKLTAAERERPEDAKVRNFRGIALAGLGRVSEAMAEYREAIRLDAHMGDAYRNLGFLEWSQHQPDTSRADLKQAVQLSPDDAFAHYYLGRVELDAQHYREAIQELERSNAAAWPDDPGFMLQLAAGYVATGREDDARTTLDNVTKLRLDPAQAAQVAYLRLQLHQRGAAIDQLRSLPASHSQPWIHFDMALAQIMSGSYADADAEAQRYLAALPSNSNRDQADAFCLIGVANARAGRSKQSIEAFQNAAKLAPSQEESWLNLTRELMDLNRYSEAITALQEALVSNPKSYALHLRLGAAYLAAGRYKESESTFRDLVSAGDPLPTSYVGLAQVQLRTGRAEEAVSQLSAAKEKLGATFLISYFLGLAFERSGNREEALTAFRDAATLKPESAEAHIGAGKAELSLGHAREAISEFESALRFDPENVQAHRLLSTAYRRAGDSQTAAKYAQSAAANSAPAVGDLVGDFFLPEWKYPPDSAQHKN